MDYVVIKYKNIRPEIDMNSDISIKSRVNLAHDVVLNISTLVSEKNAAEAAIRIMTNATNPQDFADELNEVVQTCYVNLTYLLVPYRFLSLCRTDWFTFVNRIKVFFCLSMCVTRHSNCW